MKKFKGLIACGLFAAVLSVGIGCFCGFGRNGKSFAEAVEVSDFDGLVSAIDGQAEKIIVNGDISFSSTLQIGRNVHITTNGVVSLKRGTGFDGTLISVENGASVEIVASGAEASLSLDGENLVGSASAVENKGTLVLGANVIIKNFKAHVNGVAILNAGTLTLETGSQISNNELTDYVGEATEGTDVFGIVRCDRHGVLNIKGGWIVSNANTSDGTIFMYDGSTLNMTSGEISGNTAVNGAGLFVKSADVNISGGTLSGNIASGNGGAIYAKDSADITLSGAEISTNQASASYGGAMYLTDSSKVAVNSGLIKGNSSVSSGGAIFSTSNSELEVNGGEFSSNTTKNNGGAIIAKNKLVINDGTFTGNQVQSKGGVIYAYGGGDVEINGGTFTGNTAENGGTLSVGSGGYAVIKAGTFNGNSATDGGALCVAEDGLAKVTGGTFSGNTATNKGHDVYGVGKKLADKTVKFSVIELVGGSFENINIQYGQLKVGGSVSVSGKITFNASIKADYAFLEVVSDLENKLTVKPYSYKAETSSPANTFFRNGISGPYSNVYRALDKIVLDDAAWTYQVSGDKILLVSMANKIDVIASENVLEAPKTAANGEVVSFKVMNEYEISNLSIVDDLGAAVSFSQSGDTYTFTMPTDSGVKIDYQSQKKDLALSVAEGSEAFVEVDATYKFKDKVSVKLNDIPYKSINNVYVTDGTYREDLDLAKPEFLMFNNAQIVVEYSNLYTVSYATSEQISSVDFIDGAVLKEGDTAQFRVVQNKEGNNARYSITSVYYMDGESKVEITANASGVYNFVMPAKDVEIKFEFEDVLSSIEGDATVVTTEDALAEALQTDGLVVAILDDIEITKTLEVGQGSHTILSTNGSMLKRSANFKGNLVHVAWRTELNIGSDSVLSTMVIDGDLAATNVNGSLVFVEDGGVVNINNGALLTNNNQTAQNEVYSLGIGDSSCGGAGVFNFNGIVNMRGGSIANNKSTVYGGGVYNYGKFNLLGGTIEGNSALSGGGVYNTRVFDQDGGDILNNSCETYGGGIYNYKSYYCYYYLRSGKVSGNDATSSGGGVFLNERSVMWMYGGEVSSNSATNNGGGINVKGTLFVKTGKLAENVVGSKGGAIYTYESAILKIENATFENNSAKYGGAVCVDAKVKTSIDNSTFSGNSATSRGGAIYLLGESGLVDVAVATITNVHIFGNTAAEGNGICVQYAVLEIGSGANVEDEIWTVANPTEHYAFIRFVDELDFEITIKHKKEVADYQNEPYNVLRVANGVDVNGLAEKIKIKDSGDKKYSIKVVDQNLYIYQVVAVA